MPRKPVLAYAIGGTAAAVAAIVITASTVGLTASNSDAARGGPVAAEVVLPDGTTGALTAWEDNSAYRDDEDDDEHEEREYRSAGSRFVRGEREHDDDD